MKNACELPEESRHLIRLKEITPTLKEAFRFANFFDREYKSAGWKKIDTEEGLAMIQTLTWSEDRAVSDNLASKRCTFPEHQHPGIEIFIVYKGCMLLTVNGQIVTISDQDKPYYFNAKHPHSATFSEDTEYIAITIPGDKDWI